MAQIFGINTQFLFA